MLTEKRKIVLLATGAGALLWIIDSAVDTLFFSHESFLDELILHPTPQEVYFRTLFGLSLILFALVIGKNVERRARAEQNVRQALAKVEEEKARSEAIVAAIGDGLSIQDRDFRILYQNEAHQAIVKGNWAGQHCYEKYAGLKAVCSDCPLTECFEDGKIHFRERYSDQGANARTVAITASPLRDSSGRIVAGIELVRDISDSREHQKKLQLFSEAIEKAMDGIQIVNLDGSIGYSNKAIQEIYGYSPEELAGKHVNDMNADPEFASKVIIPSLEKNGRWGGELLVKHKNGTVFPIWLSAWMIRDASDTPISLVGIVRDITEQKRAEQILTRNREQLVQLVEERTRELSVANEQLRKEIRDREKMEEEVLKAQKLESLSILAGGIAHDFNNLLTALVGNISIAMLDIDPSHPSYKQLSAAERASLRAQDLTRQLLTFSKGGAPVKKTINLGELVQDAAGFALRGSRVKSDISIAQGLDLVEADEGQISQVIHNLVINADHAMPQGGTIAIRCSNVLIDAHAMLPMSPGKYVLISVRDKGVGIPREHLTKIFDPYFTTKQKGSGLGLATTYSIIKKHDGHITVESKLGEGTTFSFYLPVSLKRSLGLRQEENGIRRGSGTILVMDDEVEVRETTGNALKKLGYAVEYAVDGKEAVDRYRQARDSGKGFDLIIMDLTVPGGMGGKEAIKKLCEIDPAVKAIVSSGYSNDPIMADYRSYGFSGVVTKPYRLRDLSEEVHRVLFAGQ